MSAKYVVTILAGIAVGAAVGLGLVYVNPLTAAATDELGRFDRVLRYDYPSDRVLMLTHAGIAPMPTTPKGVPELWESSIRSAASGLIAVPGDDSGPAVFASKIVVPSKRTDLLSTGVVLDDYWLVTIPGTGSLFVLGDSNVWPAIKENLLPVTLLGRPWSGPRSYRTTEGPGVRGTALVVGATGRFAAAEGSAIETFELKEFDRTRGVAGFTGELHIRTVAAEAQ